MPAGLRPQHLELHPEFDYKGPDYAPHSWRPEGPHGIAQPPASSGTALASIAA